MLVFALRLQFARLLDGTITQLIWLPMLAFEVPVAVWLLLKGVGLPAHIKEA